MQVVDDPTVNAYASSSPLTIGINKGLISAIGSDDELAGVLAHEAAHLVFDHLDKAQSNALKTGLLMGVLGAGMVGVAAAQGTRLPDDTVSDWVHVGMEMGSLAYSPEMELEADRFAAYAVARSGRSPRAAIDLVLRLQRGNVLASVARTKGYAGYLRTHPANDTRMAAALQAFAELQAQPGSRLLTRVGRYVEDCNAEIKRYPQCDFKAVRSAFWWHVDRPGCPPFSIGVWHPCLRKEVVVY